MSASSVFWPIVTGALGAMLKSAWDTYVGWQDKMRMETWKIRVHQLEDRLSKFYWPLYIRLQRDDNVWRKVFIELRDNSGTAKGWVTGLDREKRVALGLEIEKDILLPNHAEAVQIITSFMHLSEANSEFRNMLLRYVRHVDVYRSLRAAGLNDIDPLYVDEEYPSGLSETVRRELEKHQREYDGLLQERPVSTQISSFRELLLLKFCKSRSDSGRIGIS